MCLFMFRIYGPPKQTPIPSGTAGLGDLSETITAGWKYPRELANPQWIACTGAISIVLEEGRSCFRIGGYVAVSWGDSLQDPVAAQVYIGTERVLKDLSEMHGWSTWRVTLPWTLYCRLEERNNRVVQAKVACTRLSSFPFPKF